MLNQSGKVLIETLNNFDDGVFALNKDWDLTYLNKRAAGIVGLKPYDIVGKNLWRDFPQVKGTILEENYRQAMQTREIRRFEAIGPGTKIWFEITVYPSKEGIIVHWHDITKRKSAQQQLELEKTRLDLVINQMPAAIAVADAQTNRIVKGNSQFERIWGSPLKENASYEEFNQNWRLFHLDGTPYQLKQRPLLRSVMQGEIVVQEKVVFHRSDGYVGFLQVSSAPLLDPEGRIVAAVGVFEDITERDKAEEALRQSNERFSKLFYASPAAIVISRLEDGHIIDANESFLRLFEFSREEVIDHRSTELNIYSDPSERNTLVRLLQKQGVIRNYEIPVQTKTKRLLRTLVSVDKINLNGQAFVISTLIDITKLKDVETALSKAKDQVEQDKQRLGAFLETTPLAVVIFEAPSSKISYVNKRALALYGFDTSGIDLEANVALVKPKKTDGSPYPFEYLPASRALRGQEVHSEELIIERADGAQLPILASAAPLFDSRGNVTGAVVVFEDITSRKEVEDALRESEKKLKLSQEIAHVGSWELDLETNKLSWSDEAYRIFGLKPQEFDATYEAFLSFVHPDDRIAVDSAYSDSVRQGKDSYEIEHRIVRSGTKEIRFVHEKCLNIKKASGTVVRSVGMVQDITERKEIERKLEIYSKNLEKLVEARTKQLRDAERLATIGQVAGTVGHDISNPLQAITSEVYLAKDQLEHMPRSSQQEALKTSISYIEEQTGYIEKILGDLRNIAKPLKPSLSEVDLCSAVPDAISMIKVPANIQVASICEVASLKLKVDLTFLRRIMTNLVTNAVQAMPNGGKLTVRLFGNNDMAYITVEDTGVGIPKEAQAKLFTPLFTTKAKGQGFGLIVVKRMTEALGGTISFESEAGRGTTFTITLPLQK